MHREIFEVLDQEKVRVEELNARLRNGVSATEAHALHMEIEEIKKAGQMTVLEIQLRYAQREGRTAQAAMLERSLEVLKHPLTIEETLKQMPKP